MGYAASLNKPKTSLTRVSNTVGTTPRRRPGLVTPEGGYPSIASSCNVVPLWLSTICVATELQRHKFVRRSLNKRGALETGSVGCSASPSKPKATFGVTTLACSTGDALSEAPFGQPQPLVNPRRGKALRNKARARGGSATPSGRPLLASPLRVLSKAEQAPLTKGTLLARRAWLRKGWPRPPWL